MSPILNQTLHAVLHSQGRAFEADTEEAYMRALTAGLLEALKDNPDFAHWLLTYRHKK